MLTLEQLADATGVTPEAVQEWEALDLLSGEGDEFPAEDIERVRLILFAQRRGVGAAAIAQACETQGDMIGLWMEMVTGGHIRRGHSIEEAASATGLEPELLRRVHLAAGLGDQDVLYDEDVEAFRSMAHALDVGFPEDAMIQMVRVYADALGRVAEAESRFFHYYVHERFRREGLTGEELTEATQHVSKPLEDLMEPAILYFHHKAFQRAECEDLLLHVAQGSAPPGEAVAEMPATILFVDLSGFTALTEAMGDTAAAEVLLRFSDLVHDAAVRRGGRVIKQIGDEFMLQFSEPRAAVLCGLDIDAAAAEEGQFPALRIGAHTGTVLYREGDYIGAMVNIAARVARQAERHQFLITEDLRDEVAGMERIDLRSVGPHSLKGISGERELYDVRRTEALVESVVDPVCLMELAPDACSARLTWRGVELCFCSHRCLRQFVETPDRYPVTAPPS